MSIQVQGIEALNRRLREYQKEVSSQKAKTSILAAGGQAVKRAAAKAPTPKSKKDHKYYSGKGTVHVIKSGNLRKSMKVYRGREGDVYVGPQFLRRAPAVMGETTKTSSGYYAAALYGSALRFRREIMETALLASQQKAFAAIEKAFARYHQKTGI